MSCSDGGNWKPRYCTASESSQWWSESSLWSLLECLQACTRRKAWIAVDDCHHDNVQHMASVVFVHDLWQQAKSLCQESNLITSQEWLWLQFWPKNTCKHATVSLQYTGRLKVKYIVQQRQWRQNHEDCHYAAAVFRYMREYSVKIHDYCIFVFLDDKHCAKIGEPEFPLATAERGRKVLLKNGVYYQVGNHDRTRLSIIPSVFLIIAIPDDITGSWYDGQVAVTLKDAVFESSSPIWHAAEQCNLLSSFFCCSTSSFPLHRWSTWSSAYLHLHATFTHSHISEPRPWLSLCRAHSTMSFMVQSRRKGYGNS